MKYLEQDQDNQSFTVESQGSDLQCGKWIIIPCIKTTSVIVSYLSDAFLMLFFFFLLLSMLIYKSKVIR